ncbi:MAG: HPP family protein [Coriobacteriia bacterium]|nr:HPP family protein [Coriobacteriia bacterium]
MTKNLLNKPLAKPQDPARRRPYLLAPVTPAELLSTLVGCVLGIGLLSGLAWWSGEPWLMAPFGASALLVYAAPKAPFAQPRNLFGGHLIGALVAISMMNLFGSNPVSITAATTLAILLMQMTNTLHPPGGATALLCSMLGTTDYGFILFPLMPGVVIMFVTAVIAGRLFPEDGVYPHDPLA